ncbi:3,8-divinyl protochlorophyllide a 8-vinyl reductase, putative chloroplast precursor [Ochromonadaceae sp. CCMP2298]|nr:3,8-divinyl protochlorophyllide a 8-vinyl reductase, putative chloroplast precursor [Ochromonadaceae sp. CCMP2298]
MLSVPQLLLCSLLCGAAWAFRPTMHATLSPALRMSTAEAAAKKRVVIVGATGYIGKFVVRESVRRGYDTVAVLRPGAESRSELDGATIIRGDVTDEASLKAVFEKPADVVISCLASRSGIKSDSYLVDYQATLNTLNAAKSAGLGQFILLSAFCVQKPTLQFQQAKLKFETALQEAQGKGDIDKYSIVRPTAFFKSVSGQFELLQQGWPFVMFGDGEISKCNPIAEADLAAYMINCIEQPEQWNKVLNIGGPDEGMTMKQQGEMIFDILGKEPKFWTAPIGIFDAVIGAFAFFGQFFEGAADAAELGRIGKYYAVEDMLTETPQEKFGTVTLRGHYERIAVEGQEYDPYTTMLAPKKK